MRFCQLLAKEALVYKTGFNLIEILIYITILGLILALFSNIMHFNQNSFIKLELDKIYITCIYLQKKAILTQEKQILFLDSENNLYKFENITHKLNKNVIFGITKNMVGSPGAPDNIIKKPISFQKNKIIFYQDGIISSGSLYLTDLNRSVVYSLTCSVATINYLRKYKLGDKLNNWILIN